MIEVKTQVCHDGKQYVVLTWHRGEDGFFDFDGFGKARTFGSFGEAFWFAMASSDEVHFKLDGTWVSIPGERSAA